ncbi:MAG TPA: hypothetical protein VGL05_36100 [Kribbella sp.]
MVEEVGVPRLDARQPRLVREHLRDSRGLLALGTELRPVPAQRIVQPDLPALHQQQDARRGEALRAGEHQLDRVALRRASPQVGHQLAPVVRRERRPRLAVLGEVPLERLSHVCPHES